MFKKRGMGKLIRVAAKVPPTVIIAASRSTKAEKLPFMAIAARSRKRPLKMPIAVDMTQFQRKLRIVERYKIESAT
jgi:hypothetical protein